ADPWRFSLTRPNTAQSNRESATAPSTSGLLKSTMILRQQWYSAKGEEDLSTEDDKQMSNCGREAMQPRLRPSVTAPQKCLHKTPLQVNVITMSTTTAPLPAMAPLIPRFHLFEIDDQPWFPSFLRARVQDALLATWVNRTPGLQPASPARLAADILEREIGQASLPSHTFIDFCAGSGGPTPTIERILNRRLAAASLPPATFVLTDLHPNPASWSRAAAASSNLVYEPDPIDASAAPPSLLAQHRGSSTVSSSSSSSSATEKTKKKEIFRLFNLAFHHFPDPLARRILRDTLSTSSGFAIFELQAREPASFLACCLLGLGHKKKEIFRLFNLAFHHFPDPLARRILHDTLSTSSGFAIFELQAREPASLLACCLLGLGVLLGAPYHAWRLRSWAVLFFCWVVPVLPFVLVFDGLVSSVRTRTPDEVEALMRTCGADCEAWEVRSGSEMHLWPVGYLHWIVATKKDAPGRK
ncbi:hypothetical protein BN1723_003104, partial [Verticillium longisporum]